MSLLESVGKIMSGSGLKKELLSTINGNNRAARAQNLVYLSLSNEIVNKIQLTKRN